METEDVRIGEREHIILVFKQNNNTNLYYTQLKHIYITRTHLCVESVNGREAREIVAGFCADYK